MGIVPAIPRYGIQCFALRNRVGILSESYTYAAFKDRVLVGRAYARDIFRYVAAHRKMLRRLLAKADKPRDRIALRTEDSFLGERTVLGFVEENSGRPDACRRKKRKSTNCNCSPGVEGDRLGAKTLGIFRTGRCKAVETLQRHGMPSRNSASRSS